jgi:UDP-N-acetylglucosamine 2-epimerase (non-hydrolysing)
LVHGDTSTTAAAALCAFYNKVKLAHVEAGLRTFDLEFPWPEEGNRKIVSAISSFHFAPTQKSYDNLLLEGIKKEQIYITGNTVIDALFYAKTKVRERDYSVVSSTIQKNCNPERRSILITCHRRENHGEGVRNLCDAIVKLLTLYDDLQFIIPLHPNPAVKDVFIERLSQFESVVLIGSQDYLSFVQLMDNSHLILSDSGGVQEEAPSLGVPVLVLRDVSERPEAVEAGTVKLIGNTCANIVSKVSEVLDDENHLKPHIKDNPYGDGTACKQIRYILEEHFK